MGANESEQRIPTGVYAQTAYLDKLSAQIIEFAGNEPAVARRVLGKVHQALAFNGQDKKLLDAAGQIIRKAGPILATVSPKAGELLFQLGEDLFSKEISPQAIRIYQRTRGISLLSELPEEDLLIYEMIVRGGLFDRKTKAQIGRWLLGKSSWEPSTVEESPKKRALSALAQPGIRNTAIHLVTEMFRDGKAPEENKFSEITERFQEALAAGASEVEAFLAIFQPEAPKQGKK